MAEEKQTSTGFFIAHNLVKLLAAAVGFVVSLLGLMSLVGLFVDNVWIHLGVGLVVLIGAPLVLAELLMPKDVDKGKGMFTEIVALLYIGLALAVLAFGGFTGPLLAAEADRLDESLPLAANTARWLGGQQDKAEAPEATAKAGEPSDAEKKDAGGEEKGAEGEEKKDEVDPAELVELTPAQLFEKHAGSVVTIEVRGMRGRGGGTGFVIDKDGTIATNHHVIDRAEKIRVKFFEGDWIDEVELLDSDARVDLALLRVKYDGELKPVMLGDSDKIVVGERIVSIGNPLGLEHTLTDGLVSSRRIWEGRKMIQMSVPVSPGNSGGPIFNMKGQVLGVTTYKLGNAFNRGENLNLAVPVNVLRKMIRADYPGKKKFSSSTW